MGESAPARFPTFGFGSNSVRQLRGRLEDPTLTGFPGRIQGHVLAFAGPNQSWSLEDSGPGGVASLVPLEGEEALGTVVYLTEEQLQVLDGFEAVPWVYDRKKLAALVWREGTWKEVEVFAYLKVEVSRYFPPSEAYCCAVLRNLRGSFPNLCGLVLRDHLGSVRGHWCHPGFRDLGLGAFLYEVGVRKSSPWRLPHRIPHVREQLLSVGVGLKAAHLHDFGMEKLAETLDGEEVSITKELLSLSGSADTLPDDCGKDDSHAERSPLPMPSWSELVSMHVVAAVIEEVAEEQDAD